MAIRELPPDDPRKDPGRQVALGWVAAVLVVALAAGAAGWLLRGWSEARDPVDLSAMPIGNVADFPAGSLSEVDLGVEFYDPYGVEAETELATGPGPRPAALLVVNDPAQGVVAMYASSRWLGCRVRPIDRAEALQSHPGRVPAWFAAGLADPCHGGLYAATGERIDGPGERGLDRFPVGYEPDGTVVVDLTRPMRTGTLATARAGVSSGGAATS